ncbi:hypothetical protein [Rhodococcus sp. AD45]|uniref:hypothetical protein n=1 Tax=Rhodococcus sp. (strain AD45) TaxID=103808 RepID=UPI001392275E|nr:hypothetical protein [Rhodococcus sp. AD45]
MAKYIERLDISVIVPPHPDTVMAGGCRADRRRLPTDNARTSAGGPATADTDPPPASSSHDSGRRRGPHRAVVPPTTPAADENLAAPFRPPPAHGVRLANRTRPPHFPSASVTAAPEKPSLAPIDLYPADHIPRVLAVTALSDPIIKFPTELDTTVASTTRKAAPATVIPVTFTVPTTEPEPTQTTPPNTSVPPPSRRPSKSPPTAHRSPHHPIPVGHTGSDHTVTHPSSATPTQTAVSKKLANGQRRTANCESLQQAMDFMFEHQIERALTRIALGSRRITILVRRMRCKQN